MYLSHFSSTTKEDWPRVLLAGKIILYLDNLVRKKTLEQVENIASDLKVCAKLLFTKDGRTVQINK